MARPRSEDKRNALIAAAVEVFAEHGINAPTARIAKAAGVAEGTLFTYFSTKDALLNALYLALKGEMREAMLDGYPRAAPVRTRGEHMWRGYVDWGVSAAAKRKVMAQLAVSERIEAATRSAGSEGFADISALIHESMARGPLRDQPFEFVGAIMTSLAEATMGFIAQHPARAGEIREAGFDAFWRAVAGPD